MKQHLDIESRKALVDYRIEKSDNALKEANEFCQEIKI